MIVLTTAARQDEVALSGAGRPFNIEHCGWCGPRYSVSTTLSSELWMRIVPL
jgi:hypothetical protein